MVPAFEAKMKIYGVVLSVLYVVLVVNCEDSHHIQPRVLENKTNLETTLPPQDSVTNVIRNASNINDTKLSSSETSQNTSAILGPSAKLEQELVELRSPAPPSSTSSKTVKNNQTDESVALPQPEIGNNASLAKFNVSSLLRKNCSLSAVIKDPVYVGVIPNISTTAIEAPKVFPKADSLNGTRLIKGDSNKLQDLISYLKTATEQIENQKNIKNQSVIDAELKDLLNHTIRQAAVLYEHPMEPHEPMQLTDKIDDGTELIEDGENTEDQLRKHNKLDSGDDSSFQHRYLAAILVSSLVAVSVICYAALLLWRRYLENRYGSRTMLVNEEDFDDPSDMRHFSI